MKINFSQFRRNFIKNAAAQLPVFITTTILGGWERTLSASQKPIKVNHSTKDALSTLINGNNAFMQALGDTKEGSTTRDAYCQQLIENKIIHQKADFIKNRNEQKPKAIIIGCSDSRVSPEIIFDQGIGDLFVIRVAGNLIEGAGHSISGSIEYAVSHLNVRLIIVMGHQKCGAINAALENILNPLNISSKETINKTSHEVVEPLEELVSAIKSHLNKNEIEKALIEMSQSPNNKDKAIEKLMEIAIKRNISSGVDYLSRHEKFVPYLKLKANERLIIKGAIYSFDSGKVDYI